MHLTKPILTGWQATAAAGFIRRHQRVFTSRGTGSLILLALLLPALLITDAILPQGVSTWGMAIGLIPIFLTGGLYMVLVSAAIEEKEEHKR